MTTFFLILTKRTNFEVLVGLRLELQVSSLEFLMKSRSRLEILTRSRFRRLRSRLHHCNEARSNKVWNDIELWTKETAGKEVRFPASGQGSPAILPGNYCNSILTSYTTTVGKRVALDYVDRRQQVSVVQRGTDGWLHRVRRRRSWTLVTLDTSNVKHKKQIKSSAYMQYLLLRSTVLRDRSGQKTFKAGCDN